MADIIKFEFDQPVEVALRFPDPKVFASNYPGGDDRHMYSTTDGRVMYVTPLTSARIKALALAQGEVFWICKRKDGRLTEFAVSREPLAAGPTRTPAAPRPAPFKTNLPSRLYAPPADHAFGEQNGTLTIPKPPAQEPPSELEQQLAASIRMVEQRKAAAMAQTTAHVPAWAAALVEQSNALVDAYAQVLAHASQHSNVRSDDVRSLFLSAFINISKPGANGGRNAA